MAYLDNQDLWYELLNKDVNDAPAWWIELRKSRVRFNNAISKLHNYSLLDVSAGQYSLHTCEHDWILEYLNKDFEQERCRIAIHCVAANVSWRSEAGYWYIEPEDLYSLVYLHEKNDRNAEAEKMYERALNGCEKAWGPNHTFTLGVVKCLGILYMNQNKYDKAEQMYQRALNEYEKAWGPNDTSTLDTVNNLGIVHSDQGKYDEAEKLYQRALNGKEKAWGSNHTSTLSIVKNLSDLYADQGNYTRGEEDVSASVEWIRESMGSEPYIHF